jgi:hypothetical protein
MLEYKLHLVTPLVDSSEFQDFMIKVSPQAREVHSDNFFELLSNYTGIPAYFYDLELCKKGKSPLRIIHPDEIDKWLDNSVVGGSLVFPETLEELKDLVKKNFTKIKIEIPDEGVIFGKLTHEKGASAMGFLKYKHYFERD